MAIEKIKNTKSKQLIKMLSEVLELAKSGEIQSACIAMSFSDGCTGNCSTGTMAISLIGEIRVMERDIIDCNVETRR